MFSPYRCSAAAAAILLLSACHSASNLAGGGSTFPQSTNVGPIPGDAGSLHGTVDPYLKDAVAIQEGKRLFG